MQVFIIHNNKVHCEIKDNIDTLFCRELYALDLDNPGPRLKLIKKGYRANWGAYPNNIFIGVNLRR